MNPAQKLWYDCYRMHRKAAGHMRQAARLKGHDREREVHTKEVEALYADMDRFGSMNEVAIPAAFFRANPVWRYAIHSAAEAFTGDAGAQTLCLEAHRQALERRTMDNRYRPDRRLPEQKWYPATKFNRQRKV